MRQKTSRESLIRKASTMKTFVSGKKPSTPDPKNHLRSPTPSPTRHGGTHRELIRRILRGSPDQNKLTVGAPDDVHERQAEQVADAVMRMPDKSFRHRPESQAINDVKSRNLLNSHSLVSEDPTLNSALRQDSGHPLPSAQTAFFESRFGCDFKKVRIHTDTSAAATARNLGARAFTVGRDLFSVRASMHLAPLPANACWRMN